MLTYEPGRVDDRAPDPAYGHYIISESTEYEWRMLVEGMRAAATLCEAFDGERSELPETSIGALFHVFAQHAATLAAEAQLSFSPRGCGA